MRTRKQVWVLSVAMIALQIGASVQVGAREVTSTGQRSSPQLQSRSAERTLQSTATSKSRVLRQKARQSEKAARQIRKSLPTKQRKQFDAISRHMEQAAIDTRARNQVIKEWKVLVKSRASKNTKLNINTMVQAVMYEAWRQEEQDLRRVVVKVNRLNESKRQVRAELSRARDHRQKMARLPAENRVYRPARIKGIQAPAAVHTAEEMGALIEHWEDELSTIGDDAQLANIDLQNMLQKQQQTIQTLSNISKVLHDTALAVIRKIG